jgi:hypothetical protein
MIVVVSGSAPFIAPVSHEAFVPDLTTGPMLMVRVDLEKSAIILRETHGEVNTILDDISGAALAGQQ